MNQISIRDGESVIFFGDSLTQQHLYSAFVETFLISRFPEKRLRINNFGWGGNNAADGIRRFERDIAPARPTLVFVSFAANDGKHSGDRDAYPQRQRKLAAMIKDLGARQVFLTCSPFDYTIRPDKDQFNEILAGMAQIVSGIARELNLGFVDIHTPMRELQRRAKSTDPNFNMMPDGVHPSPVGHLIMSYYILRQIEAPRSVAEIEINSGKLLPTPVIPSESFRAQDGVCRFDLKLPCIPLYVPPEARAALQLVPFQEELNRFTLRVGGLDPQLDCAMVIDGNEKDATFFPARQLEQGIDLALMDNAPWAAQGRRLWELSQHRWKKHCEAWREMSVEAPEDLAALETHRKLIAAQHAYVAELGDAMRKCAQPQLHRILLRPAKVLTLKQLDVSPRYPYTESDFNKAYPPESDRNVEWTPVALQDDRLDLGKHFNQANDCVSYVRLRLEAEKACRVHLVLGSDDGLSIFHNGKRVLDRNLRRPCRLGDDELDVEIQPGKNELLFRVTQFGGAYLLAIKAIAFGRISVLNS